MLLTYHGHSCFKLKGRLGTVVTDPFSSTVGFSLPNLSADIVTVSHDHSDHNNIGGVKGTARREKPFVIQNLGEYEVDGISIFGAKSFHDAEQGVSRGENRIFTIVIDGVRVCHLGDLGHEIDENLMSEIGPVDVLLIPVGGVYTINARQAVAVARALEPSYVVPMHFKTTAHDEQTYADLQTIEDFVKEFGAEKVETVDQLKVDLDRLPEEKELVIVERT